MKESDYSYALDNTHILYEPDRRIDTFGDTRYNFLLLSEPMDLTGQCRIRSGWVEAQKPKIISPAAYRELSLDGFGEQGKEFFEWLEQQGTMRALLQYGFRFSRSNIHEETIHESIDTVRPRMLEETLLEGNEFRTLIEGVDDAWEICLLKFTVEMVQRSHDINVFDFRRKGLL